MSQTLRNITLALGTIILTACLCLSVLLIAGASYVFLIQ